MWPFGTRIRRSWLNRWLKGAAEPALIFGLSSLPRDDLEWEAYRRYRSGEFADSLAIFDLIWILWPTTGFEQALLGKGTCLQSLGRLDEAESCYSRLLESMPECIHAWLNRAEVRLIKGSAQGALADSIKARGEIARQNADSTLLVRADQLVTLAQKQASLSSNADPHHQTV